MNSQFCHPLETANEAVLSETESGGDELVPVLHRVARRADELWTQAGRDHGHDLQYWLQAEREEFGRQH